MAVSYLISSYNKAEYLQAVLQSAARELATTEGEIIIIDDGSRDASWSHIDAFAKTDVRIAAHRQANCGIFNVTNQLLAMASQKWLRILDCDDPPISGSTRAMIKVAEENNVDYVFGSTIPYGLAPISIADVTVQREPGKIEILEDPLRYAIREYNHVPSTALIRHEAVPKSLALNENLISCQDLALSLPIFFDARVARIDVPVCHQLVGSSKRLSSNEALTYFQTIQIIKEFGEVRFSHTYKCMAARKIVSRAIRWMRRHNMVMTDPALYLKLVGIYLNLKFTPPRDWVYCLDTASRAYASSIPHDRLIY